MALSIDHCVAHTRAAQVPLPSSPNTTGKGRSLTIIDSKRIGTFYTGLQLKLTLEPMYWGISPQITDLNGDYLLTDVFAANTKPTLYMHSSITIQAMVLVWHS